MKIGGYVESRGGELEGKGVGEEGNDILGGKSISRLRISFLERKSCDDCKLRAFLSNMWPVTSLSRTPRAYKLGYYREPKVWAYHCEFLPPQTRAHDV